MKNLKSIIESILLVAEKPVSMKELAQIAGAMISQVQKEVLALQKEFQNRGMRIIRKGEFVHLVSDPENAEYVAKYLHEELRSDLTQPALETLAIIAHKEPLTRIEIEEIRGVNSEQILRNLMIRGLINEIGRKETLGRPILYGTTIEFLQYFGLEKKPEISKPKEKKSLFDTQNKKE